MPHASGVLVERRETEEDGVEHIDALVLVEKDGQKGILIGKHGAMLGRITQEAQRDIEKFLGHKVHLTLFIRVENEWRNKDRAIETFGYGNIDD